MSTYHEIQSRRADMEQAQDQYLRRFGWELTCETPGCYWLWQRKLDDGRVILANRDMAINMTRAEFDLDSDGQSANFPPGETR